MASEAPNATKGAKASGKLDRYNLCNRIQLLSSARLVGRPAIIMVRGAAYPKVHHTNAHQTTFFRLIVAEDQFEQYAPLIGLSSQTCASSLYRCLYNESVGGVTFDRFRAYVAVLSCSSDGSISTCIPPKRKLATVSLSNV